MFASKTTRAARFARVLGAAALAVIASSAGAAEAGGTGSAARQEKVPSSYPALQEMKPVDVMHMIDTKNKGYVTREEYLKFQEAVFDRIDRDRDRKLSEVEFTDRG